MLNRRVSFLVQFLPMHGNRGQRPRVIPTPLVIPQTEYQKGNEKRKIREEAEDELSPIDDFWSLDMMQPSDLISPLTPTQTSELSRDTSTLAPEPDRPSNEFLKSHQRFHLWQNLNTGECQYRLANVDQILTSYSSFHPLFCQAIRPRGYSVSTPRLHCLTSLTPIKKIGQIEEQGKKQRMNWSGALQDAFENALTELGPKATPNPIRERLHAVGFVGVTRKQVASHLQKHKSKQQTAKQKTLTEESYTTVEKGKDNKP